MDANCGALPCIFFSMQFPPSFLANSIPCKFSAPAIDPTVQPSRISWDVPYFSLCVPRPGLSLPGTQDVPYFGLFIAFVSNTSIRIEFQYKVSRYDSSSWSPVALTANFEAPETYFALFLQRFLSQIFSLMNAKWTAERNRASVALIRSEL